MHRIITYSLRLSSLNSDEYYQTISSFTDYWLAHLKHKARNILINFRDYLHQAGFPNRTDDEVAFEFLALGVLLQEYLGKAQELPEWLFHLRIFLVDLPARWSKLEGLTKKATGLVNGLIKLLIGNNFKGEDIPGLISWLKSNGETIKAERFSQWYEFLRTSVNPKYAEVLRICIDLSYEFKRSGIESLGKYTEMVDTFLITAALEHRWKYDAPLVSKSGTEYHLGMLGTEILNRVNRQIFLNTTQKIVIVPPCMRAPKKKCKASETSFGARCNFCTPSCRINQITKMGGKYGFDVFTIPDDMKTFTKAGIKDKFGLVGISCVLTNWNGGWETSSLDLPAQGILLDYVGCKYHWDRKGFPTDCNLGKLKTLLGISPAEQELERDFYEK